VQDPDYRITHHASSEARTLAAATRIAHGQPRPGDAERADRLLDELARMEAMFGPSAVEDDWSI
jgi:hypothetical protein